MSDTGPSATAEPNPGAGGSTERGRRLDALLASVVALAFGALWGACFQSEPRPILALVALGPLLLLLLRPLGPAPADWPLRGTLGCFGLGWLHGIACWMYSVPWIASVLRVHGGLPWWLAIVLWIALCAYLGAYHAVFAVLARRLLARASPLWLALAVPGAWVALEWLRSVLITGFPWNLAAYAWVSVPGALPASAWIGSFGVSFLVVLTQVAWFVALRRRSPRPLIALAPALVLLGAGALATPSADGAPSLDDAPEQGRVVRVVQPDIGIEESGPGSLATMVELSSCPQLEGLVVWPESATYPRQWQSDPALRGAILEIARNGCEVLFNTSRWEGDEAFNTAMVVGAEGEIARYDKVHLVPFGEYVPLAGLFPFLDEIARNAGGYTAADDLVTLPWGDESLGVAICFEITLPGQVAELVARGATVLATLTNDSWYGDTSAPRQHFVSARFRAAENRRPLVRAAITGISAVVDSWGRPLERLGVGERGAIEHSVAGRTDRTLYSRAPWAVPSLSVVLAIFGLARPRRLDTIPGEVPVRE